MEIEKSRLIFNCFTEGKITALNWDGPNMGMQIFHPLLAKHINKDFTFFYITLKECSKFYFQPMLDTNTVIEDLDQMVQLELKIQTAGKISDNQLKIYCYMEGEERAHGRIVVSAKEIKVYDQDFDVITPVLIDSLRYKVFHFEDQSV